MVDKPVVAWPLRHGVDHAGGDGPWSIVGILAAKLAPQSPILISAPSQRVRSYLTPPGAAGELRSLLARAVEAEVVPRLLLRQRAATGRGRKDGVSEEEAAPGPEDVVALVALVMTSDVPTTLCFVEALRARGVSLDRLYLELLAPAARRLGQLWVEDLCTFADVTMALGRLQQVLRALSPAFMPPGGLRDSRRRAALLPMPGEQHTFGLAMVTEFFLRAGWDVWSEPQASGDELAGLVGDQWFAVLGLSVSCDSEADRLPGLIRSVRRASRNPAIGVMVGGRIFSENPGLAAQVGADATALDGLQAALQAETLLALLAGRTAR
jgi:methanogenic corrinoid protein MtbC1